MKFIKVKHNSRFCKEHSTPDSWKLILTEHSDYLSYREMSERREIQSFLQAPWSDRELSHASDSTCKKKMMIKIIAESRGISLIEALTVTLESKYETIKSMIEYGKSVLVNETGSYSDMDSYFDIHECEIVKTLESEGIVFPVNDSFDPLNNESILLENHERTERSESGLARRFDEYFKCEVPEDLGLIFDLRNRDREWLLRSIMNSKNIYTSTTAQDFKQITDLYNQLKELRVSDKTLHICVHGSNAKKKIEELFENEVYNKVIIY
ncbi:gp35 [Sphingomonas phage PAU]|uniref:gp35 n=1 Tax=Sphingomonas phage PAU TaxID=1150991 RepID=UPI0002573128|nr:gp35 [Sphingomonas phage PAU]AFF28033.1 gp35 [Sphingomonas phage PAU]